jgi:hypothetical protein
VHRVLHALGADGHADIVEAAEEGLPQLTMLDSQRRVLLTRIKIKDMQNKTTTKNILAPKKFKSCSMAQTKETSRVPVSNN